MPTSASEKLLTMAGLEPAIQLSINWHYVPLA
jgi:hypothetical protein